MKLEIHTTNHIINLFAPFKSLITLLKYKATIPLIVDRRKFIEYGNSKTYIVRQDGDKGEWFAHEDTFTNVMEDRRITFNDTPVGALINYISDHDEATS